MNERNTPYIIHRVAVNDEWLEENNQKIKFDPGLSKAELASWVISRFLWSGFLFLAAAASIYKKYGEGSSLLTHGIVNTLRSIPNGVGSTGNKDTHELRGIPIGKIYKLSQVTSPSLREHYKLEVRDKLPDNLQDKKDTYIILPGKVYFVKKRMFSNKMYAKEVLNLNRKPSIFDKLFIISKIFRK